MAIRPEDRFKRPTIAEMGGLPGIYGERYQRFTEMLDAHYIDPKLHPKSEIMKAFNISRSTLKRHIVLDKIDRPDNG